MRQIRHGVFETNSSSTHTLTICTKEEYKQFEKGDLVFDRYADQLVSKYKTINIVDEYGRYQSFEEFGDTDYLEQYYHEFTTPSGDQMVAFGMYGFDG